MRSDNKKIIYIERTEAITSIIDKLIKEKSPRIFLVIPSNAVFWQNIINLRLLKREAANLNKSLVIINSDKIKKDLARRVGFAVLDELDEEPEEKIGANDEIYGTEKSLEKLLLEDGFNKETKISLSQPRKVFDIVILKPSLTKPKKTSAIQKPAGPEIFKPEEIAELKEKEELGEAFFKKRKPQITAGQKIKQSTFFPRFLGILKIFRLSSALIFIAVILVAGLIFKVLPRAEVVITPKKEKINFNYTVVLDKKSSEINFEKNKLPAQIIRIEDKLKKEFLSSGEKEVRDKAQGVIFIYNELDSMPQPMVPSRFEASDGKIFWSKSGIIVPGATIKDGKIIPGGIEVRVEAAQPGSEYNKDCSESNPCYFTIPAWKGTVKFEKLYAKAFAPIKGGAIGRVKVATKEDMKRANDEVMTELRSRLKTSLKTKTPPELSFIEESIREEILKSSYNVKEGDVADEFSFELVLANETFIFKKENIKEIIDYNLAKQIKSDEKLLDRTQEFKISLVSQSDENIILEVQGSEEAVSLINVDLIREEILGYDENLLRDYFNSFPAIDNVKIKLWPFWVNKAPQSKTKIKVIIKEN